MNELKLEILRQLGLCNNGYSTRALTVANAVLAFGVDWNTAALAFDSLVEFGHIRFVGVMDYQKGNLVCLPEHYRAVVEVLKEVGAPVGGNR